MEQYKISKLLKDLTISKFVARTWTELNDLSGGQYSVNKNVRFKTPMLDQIYLTIVMHILL